MATRIREKAEARKQNKDTRPYAVVRYVRMSPSKVRIVLDTIRGQKAEDAVAILANTPNKAADIIKDVIESAAANGENNMGLNKADMFVAEIYSGEGPIMKRQNIRARGRVDRILKRTSHVYVVLDTATV